MYAVREHIPKICVADKNTGPLFCIFPIKVGVYHYSYADSVENAKREISMWFPEFLDSYLDN